MYNYPANFVYPDKFDESYNLYRQNEETDNSTYIEGENCPPLFSQRPMFQYELNDEYLEEDLYRRPPRRPYYVRPPYGRPPYWYGRPPYYYGGAPYYGYGRPPYYGFGYNPYYPIVPWWTIGLF